MGVINPEAADKTMDASTRSMRHSSAIVRGTAWYSLATRGLVIGGGVGGGVGRMVYCNSYSNS